MEGSEELMAAAHPGVRAVDVNMNQLGDLIEQWRVCLPSVAHCQVFMYVGEKLGLERSLDALASFRNVHLPGGRQKGRERQGIEFGRISVLKSCGPSEGGEIVRTNLGSFPQAAGEVEDEAGNK